MFAVASDTVGAALLLGTLTNNGGTHAGFANPAPVPTILPAAGRPVINGGNPTSCTDPQAEGGFLNVDERGFAKPIARCDSGAIETTCGDGTLDPGEQCDDGNSVDNDACPNTCKSPSCGDGSIDGSEQCDNGSANSNTSDCLASCVSATCGDGFVWAGHEDCDGGANPKTACPYNSSSCTVCSATCTNTAGTTSYCGDGRVDTSEGEQCDDGNVISNDGCSAICETDTATSGDGTTAAGKKGGGCQATEPTTLALVVIATLLTARRRRGVRGD